jgi:hypothetical protein
MEISDQHNLFQLRDEPTNEAVGFTENTGKIMFVGNGKVLADVDQAHLYAMRLIRMCNRIKGTERK